MSRIGKNVRMYRERAGLTQEHLAELVRYREKAMISQIEQGLKSPSLEKAQDLAIQLGVSLSALVGEHAACHSVRNDVSGDHAVIQNIEGHYCALHRDDLTVLTTQVQGISQGLETLRAQLEVLTRLLQPAAPGSRLHAPSGGVA